MWIRKSVLLFFCFLFLSYSDCICMYSCCVYIYQLSEKLADTNTFSSGCDNSCCFIMLVDVIAFQYKHTEYAVTLRKIAFPLIISWLIDYHQMLARFHCVWYDCNMLSMKVLLYVTIAAICKLFTTTSFHWACLMYVAVDTGCRFECFILPMRYFRLLPFCLSIKRVSGQCLAAGIRYLTEKSRLFTEAKVRRASPPV